MPNKKLYKGATCITPDCNRAAFSRGVCNRCYFLYRQAMARKQVTEQELIERGLWKQTTWKSTPVAKALAALSAK